MKQMDDRIIEAISYLPKDTLDPVIVEKTIEKAVKEWFPTIGAMSVEAIDGTCVFHTVKSGIGRATAINSALLKSPGFNELVNISKQALKLGKPPFKVITDKVTLEAQNHREIGTILMEEAKKGFSLQRYKGLGEMNPSQLWETTMEPEGRLLLQVRIEDAVETDNIFTILMGDEVAPRREFIQDNALRVTNLDI
jgi:DNA gyrase subunit B